jgi:hypothetical protein
MHAFRRTAVTLDPQQFRYACSMLDYWPDIDAFADAHHHQLPRYWSQDPSDPNAEAVDAFAQPWFERNLYVNPPWYRIPDVLRRVIRDNAVVLMILPVWPKAPWYSLYRRLRVSHARLRPDCYLDRAGNRRPPPPWFTVAAVVNGALVH